MKISHIYWFAHYNPEGPCVRYRGIYFLDHLRDRYGITSSFVYPGYHWQNILHFMRVWFSVLLFRRKDSLIVFQKIYTNGIYANSLKFLLFFQKKHTIYDIDDAYYLKFPSSTIHHFLRRTRTVIAGSLELQQYCLRFNPNVYLNPSPVIPHRVYETQLNDMLAVGWIGFYNAHRDSLMKLFFPALQSLGFPVHLTLLGVTNPAHNQEIRDHFAGKKNVVIEIPERIPWRDEDWIYERISGFRIGISPLLDNEYNRSKSAFKLKQYLSCRVPVLGSRVGENDRVILDGKNGFFCDTPAQFAERLLFFSRMPDDEYRQFREEALKSSEEHSMERYGCEFMRIIGSSCSGQ